MMIMCVRPWGESAGSRGPRPRGRSTLKCPNALCHRDAITHLTYYAAVDIEMRKLDFPGAIKGACGMQGCAHQSDERLVLVLNWR